MLRSALLNVMIKAAQKAARGLKRDFGEIEQRGAALTPEGRALYDSLLAEARRASRGRPAAEAGDILKKTFAAFPDDLATLRERKLAYFQYAPTEAGLRAAREGDAAESIETLLRAGLVAAHPIIYEDFLPVSAAGIFRSNLGAEDGQDFALSPNKPAFEDALRAPVLDEFALYARIERDSIARCLDRLGRPVRAA